MLHGSSLPPHLKQTELQPKLALDPDRQIPKNEEASIWDHVSWEKSVVRI